MFRMSLKMTLILLIFTTILIGFSFSASAEQSSFIPIWVKSIAGWWSEGKVSDNEFVGAMQFLINSNIIKIPNNSTDNETQLQQIDQLHQQIYTLQNQLNSANSQIASLQQQSTSQTNQNPAASSQTSNLDPQKSLAKSWYQGQISDASYIQEIQNLIDNGTIPPFNGISTGDGTMSIPAWVKTNAGWWSDGQISDDDHRAGLKYLFNNGYLHNPTANSQNNITPQTTDIYLNSIYKFSMQQPSGWLMKEGITAQVGSAIVMYVPSIQSGQVYVTNINVKSEDMQGYSFSNYITSSKTILQNAYSAYDFIMLNEGSTNVNGKSAYFFQYAVNMGVPVKIKQVIIVNNNNAFIITYGSTQDTYDEYVNQFENTVSSFKFLE